MRKKNKNITIYKYFQILFNKLYRIQYNLKSFFRFPEFLYNKIITVYLRNSSYNLIFTNSSNEINKLINKLQIFILIYKNKKKALEI